MEGGSQCQNLEAKMSSSVTAYHLDQLLSVLYATEDEYGIATMSSSQVPQPDYVQIPPNQSSSKEHHRFYANLIGTQLQVPSDKQNNPNLIVSSQRERSYPRDMEVASFTSSSSCASSGPSLPCKKRIKWSQDLHKKFVHCVNCLGGAEKATPKAILKMMESEGLTIFHVKSHLQKYRSEKYMSGCRLDKALLQGKAESISIDIPLLYMKNNMQINEALKLRLDFEKNLHQQLEIQRQLQLQIEENARQLKMMLQQQQRINKHNP